MPYTTFAEECSIIKKGIFNINSTCYCNDGIPFVRISNLKDMAIDTTDIVHIPDYEHKKNYKTELVKDDIILSKTAIPAASIVDINCCNVSQDTVAIKLKSNSKLLSHYVVVFLNTKYGLEQMQRRFTGNVQMHLNLEECKNEVLLPVFSFDFQEKIKTLFERALFSRKKSKSLYSEAEDILLSELGLKDWQPKMKSVSIRSFKDFAKSGRLDAEYYQSKYEEIEEKIKSVQCKSVAELQLFNTRGVQPDYVSDGTVSVVNSKHILENGLDYDNFEKTTFKFLQENERAKIHFNDILIYTTGANIGRAQPYLLKTDALASNHVNILRLKNVNSIYAALALNTIIGRSQTEKYCSGSAQVELYPSDIEHFLIPILPEQTQNFIAEKILKSFDLRKQSKDLLEQAKKMVENEIEKVNMS